MCHRLFKGAGNVRKLEEIYNDLKAEERPDRQNALYAEYVQTTIDMTVQGYDDEFPVTSGTLVKAGIATRAQLDILEEQGHIQSVTIDVPSVLMPGKTVPEKAYYTNSRVPRFVLELSPSE